LISSRDGETGGGDTAMPIPWRSFGKMRKGDDEEKGRKQKRRGFYTLHPLR
jgi:hypothetical protein